MIVDYGSVLWVDINSNVGEDSDPELVTDTGAINNSLLNIFSCMVGTRPNEREYGSYLLAELFQPTDNITADDIIFGLIQSVERWEPRIFVRRDDSYVRPLPNDEGFDIRVGYIVKRTQQSFRFQFQARRTN